MSTTENNVDDFIMQLMHDQFTGKVPVGYCDHNGVDSKDMRKIIAFINKGNFEKMLDAREWEFSPQTRYYVICNAKKNKIAVTKRETDHVPYEWFQEFANDWVISTGDEPLSEEEIVSLLEPLLENLQDMDQDDQEEQDTTSGNAYDNRSKEKIKEDRKMGEHMALSSDPELLSKVATVYAFTGSDPKYLGGYIRMTYFPGIQLKLRKQPCECK